MYLANMSQYIMYVPFQLTRQQLNEFGCSWYNLDISSTFAEVQKGVNVPRGKILLYETNILIKPILCDWPDKFYGFHPGVGST